MSSAAMKELLIRRLYPLALGGSLAVFWFGLAFDGPLEMLVFGWSALVLGLGAWLERHAPVDPRWAQAQGDTALDLSSAGLLIGVVDPLLKAGLAVLAAALLGSTEATAWPLHDWPLALQVALATLWIEFAKYWSHRAHHELPALWRLHALHHSSQRLYWLNNFRFHPLNHALNGLFSLLPLLLLGVPQTVLLGAVTFTQPVLMLQHLNLDTRNGWLNRLFSTNELHRWHHSSEAAEANANYGSALLIWDQLFGSYRPQPGRRAPARLGLFGAASPKPGSYWTQLVEPLIPGCCRAA